MATQGGEMARPTAHGWEIASSSSEVPAPNCTAGLMNSGIFRLNIPWICEGYDEGAMDWQATICSPFWGYGTMTLMLVFFSLGLLRVYARAKASTWLRRGGDEGNGKKNHISSDPMSQRPLLDPRPESDAASGSASASGSRRTEGRGHEWAAQRRRNLQQEMDETDPAHGLGNGRWTRWSNKPHIKMIRSTWSCVVMLIYRIVLQILQWWVCMILILVIFLVVDMKDVQKRYNISFIYFWKINKSAFSDTNIPDWLVSFSIYSFAALIVSYAISTVCIILQVLTHITEAICGLRMQCRLCQAGAGIISLPRDVAIQVLLLPMVYGLLSVRSVVCMWSLMTSQFEPALDCPSWNVTQGRYIARTHEDRVKLQKDVYASNFALADMYEAWALFCFARMVGEVMQPELRKKIKMDVVRAFEGLLLVDVSVFVLVCAVGAAYQIFLTWMKWRLGYDICADRQKKAICLVQPYIMGANWCVSSIAIYNLIMIETKFHHLSIMEKFKPRLKFWSIKLMVLVAFWATFLMGFISQAWHLTEEQSLLLDASFRTYVMAIVSMLNIKAWYPWARWYHHVLNSTAQADLRKSETVMRDIGVKTVPQGTILLVQKLFPKLLEEKDAEDWTRVDEMIDGLNDEQVDSVLWKGSQHGWVVPTDLDGQKRGKTRKALCDSDVEEKKRALKEHLMSFYPHV